MEEQSAVAKRKRKSRALAKLHDAGGGALAIREQIFALAKFDLVAQAELFASTVTAIKDGLVAMRDEHYVVPGARGEGATLERVTGIDMASRLRAVALAHDLVGVKPSRSDAAASGSAAGQVVNVNVTLRDMAPTAQSVPVVIEVDGTVIASPSTTHASAPGTRDAQAGAA